MAPGSRLIILFTVLVLLAASVLGSSSTTSTITSFHTGTSSSTRPTGTAYSLAMQMCWGKGAICSVAHDFNEEECDSVDDAHGLDKWWECICTSGAGAVDVACDNCLDAYGLGRAIANTTSICESRDLTLAPIPDSIISQQSRHNATRATELTTDSYTYIVTVQATQPELPAITTTARLPLDTGAASHQMAQYGLLVGGPVAVGFILAM
ncbi:hypothetical protein VTH82DRAFT_1587 [Thermothelomyces myriococcoides]